MNIFIKKEKIFDKNNHNDNYNSTIHIEKNSEQINGTDIRTTLSVETNINGNLVADEIKTNDKEENHNTIITKQKENISLFMEKNKAKRPKNLYTSSIQICFKCDHPMVFAHEEKAQRLT